VDKYCSLPTASLSRQGPTVSQGLSFYIFTLPFVSFVVTGFVALIVALIVTTDPLPQRRDPRTRVTRGSRRA